MMIAVALASLIVGAVGAGSVVAFAGGHDRGERAGRGDDGRGRMDHRHGFDKRGGNGQFRGQPGVPGDDQPSQPTPSTTPSPATPSPST